MEEKKQGLKNLENPKAFSEYSRTIGENQKSVQQRKEK